MLLGNKFGKGKKIKYHIWFYCILVFQQEVRNIMEVYHTTLMHCVISDLNSISGD